MHDLLAWLDAGLCVDATRTFVAGFSTGGGMAQLAACRLTETVSGVGLVAATYMNCRANLPLVAFHGLDDTSVPFEGGEIPPDRGGGTFPPVRRSVSEWARTMGCDGLANISRPFTDIEISTFINCPAGDGQVMMYAVIGGGHTWPGAAPLESAGPTTDRISATELMLDFFSTHARQ
jgi:polyhydroxybutyrate depolymerase